MARASSLRSKGPKLDPSVRLSVVKLITTISTLLFYNEIIAMIKGIIAATLCPTISLYLARSGMSQAYCGWGGHSLAYHVGTFMVTFMLSKGPELDPSVRFYKEGRTLITVYLELKGLS